VFGIVLVEGEGYHNYKKEEYHSTYAHMIHGSSWRSALDLGFWHMRLGIFEGCHNSCGV
jgi:hypothetical protein